jgi:hypothetical protein
MSAGVPEEVVDLVPGCKPALAGVFQSTIDAVEFGLRCLIGAGPKFRIDLPHAFG